MGYWRTYYGDKIGNKKFVEGLIAGVETFAIWKDGVPLVGCREIPLKNVVKEIREQLLEEKR